METSAAAFMARDEAERRTAVYVSMLRQLEYDTESRKVVLVEDAVRVAAAEYAQVRTKLLAIPAEQAPRLHRLKTIPEVQDALMEMIVEALEALTSDTEQSISGRT